MQQNGSTEKLEPGAGITYAEMEALAYRNGWRIRFKDGRVINPGREKRPDSPAGEPETPTAP